MSTIITPSEEQINIVVNDEKISINVESGDVIVNVNEQIVEVSTVNGGYPLPTTVYSVFGRTGNIIAVDGDYDLGELGDVTLVSSTNGDVLTYDGTKWINKAVTGTGTVTSVNMSVPVGLQVSGNPITVAGTLAVNFAAGYSLPTTAKQTTWDAAYNDSIVSASVSGTTTKTLTLTQQDGGTITASWTDIDTNLVTSVNGYVGTVVLTTSDIAEGSRLYYTETRVSNNTDVAANTAARHSAVTIGTANGLSLASQVLSLALASGSTTGALSSTDWATFNNKVPYSGATGNVTLGEYQLSAGQIAFDQSPTGTAGVGILRWNDSDGTLDLGLKGGNVTLQVGQEMVARVVNKTGADLLESGYKVVRISSAQGQRLAVQLAQANNDTNSTDTIGIVTETIANNQEGFITILGQVKEINTTGSLQGETWADGDVLYLSPTTAGNITNIKPIAPSHMVVVGYVEYAHSQHGKIYCKTQNGYELEELHDCYLPTYVSNGVLYRDTTNNLWKNASIATVLGYTPISLASLSGVSPLSYDNTTGAFSIAQATTSANGYLSSTDWNTFNGKQAALNGTGFVKASGTTISYDNSTYYLASNPSAYIALTGLSATAPLSYNNTTGGFTISQAGVSGNGYLSSTDWNTFNNKQASGNYITALSGEATASGPGSAAVTLSTSAVTGKLLTGVNITGGSISATDSILVAFGKVQNQINGVLGGAIYQSVWNASTNSPTLTSGTGTKGYYYIVSVAGSTNLDGITDWKIGDWAIFNGTTWNKVDNSDAVSSVNGFTGAVSLTTANISEVTNLYYTDVRVSANTDVAANTAARHAAVTLGTANGLSLSTQALSLGLASTSATGALSSTDWNTFNGKQAALSGTGFVKISGTTISYDNSTYYLASNPNGYTTNVGTVTSVAALTIGTSGTDLSSSVANSTTTPVITLNVPTASATNRGALSSADWTTFNSKQGTITLTTTGTSGAATLIANTLNIPNYGSALSGYLPLTGGTLTGPLNGTGLVINNNGEALRAYGASPNVSFYNSANTVRGGYINHNGTDMNIVSNVGIIYMGSATTFTNNITVISPLSSTAIGTTGQIQISSSTGLASPASDIYLQAVVDSATAGDRGTAFVVQTGRTSGIAERFRIASTGAATFSSSVTITSDASANALILRTRSGDDYSFFNWRNNSGTELLAEQYLQRTAANTAIMRYTIANGGSPATYLTIASTGAATFSSSIDNAGNITSTVGATNTSLFLKRTGNTFECVVQDNQSRIRTFGASGNDKDLLFDTDNAGTTRLFIKASTGNVGIGTSSPLTKLDIVGSGGSVGMLLDGAATPSLQLYSLTNEAGIGTNSYTSKPLTFKVNMTYGVVNSGTEAMRITSGGNVNIAGSASSNTRLTVTGVDSTTSNYAFVANNTSTNMFLIRNDGAITAIGSITAASFFESSDSRLKTLIQDNYQTKGIASITPKLYTKNGKVELGYYAQDFVGVLDSAVVKGSDDMLSLSYREVLVAKVYALEQEIKDLKAKLN